MSSLIAAVLVGVGFAYFATQNTVGVTLQFGHYFFYSVPIYIVALGALLIGLILAWIIYLVRTTAFALTLFGKNNQIKASQKTVEQLELRIKNLEVENAELKAQSPVIVTPPSRMAKLKQSLLT